MPKITIAILVFILAFGGLVVCADDPPDEQNDARKPSWWPDPKDSPYGLRWPPPKPDGWPDDKPWPPLKEVGEDPAFWTELYGEDIDTEKDKRLKRSGKLGNEKFRYNFERIYHLDRNKKPGCGMHVVAGWSQSTSNSCTPFPEAEVRAHCKIAFDEKTVLQQCRRHCMRNTRQCRLGRLIEPPFEAYWRCVTFPCYDHDGQPETCTDQRVLTDCAAFYLCDCYEL